jgi:signal transduction histidine kinase
VTLLRSFRARLVLGALLGTAGLLGIAHILTIALLSRHVVVLHAGAVKLLAAAALLSLVAGVWYASRGLSTFDQLRVRLSAVRDGRDRLIEGTYPAEVQPLVTDLNALLQSRDEIVRRAQAKAGDLAHGLKTPLAVLSQEAERAEAAGHADLAATIGQQVERMRRQVDYHLAQARAAGSGARSGARCSVKESADGLARTLLRLHAERGLTIHVDISPEVSFRGQREDLDEMLGNLLDNACQWAKSRVTVNASETAGSVAITVEDDGPGLAPEMRTVVLKRGMRADEAAPGSGLGLAIVRDLAELYGGSVALDASPAGGLRALLALPA